MRFLTVLFLSVLLTSCAKRGFITGGSKDTIPPIIKLTIPKNFTTKFNANEIILSFDEYVKLKDVNKQLIISPPMAKQPDISPLIATKQIKIKLKEDLLPNTTYSFNFGQSIQDNNENNVLQQFKYIISTGEYIDSLSLKGVIKDAYSKKVDNFVSIMLYEKDEKYSDSIVYKEKPRYITNTLDSAKTFVLNNLKAGKYMLVALKDVNNNFKFDSKIDKIGFYNQTITIPDSSVYQLELFKEEQPLTTNRPFQSANNKITIGYNGKLQKPTIELKTNSETLPITVTQLHKKDSLQVWFKPQTLDSLQLKFKQHNYSKDYTVMLKSQKTDTLTITPSNNTVLHFRETFSVLSSTPLVKIDESKIQFTNKDSVAVNFKTIYNKETQQIDFDFTKEPLEKYKIILNKGAFTDMFDTVNDSVTYNFNTKNASDYGNLKLNLTGVRAFPIIIELTDSKGNVKAAAYSTKETTIDFNLLEPLLYIVRIIYDDNKNGVWDTGNYLNRKQTEEVFYNSIDIDVRTNWDVNQTINLGY